MQFFLQGLTMGLAYIAPIGMQNLFVINAALKYSRKRALLTAGIVLFFDITLSISCFYGIGLIMSHYKWLQFVVLLAGSFIIMYMGIHLLRTTPHVEEFSHPQASLKKTISEACFVTWLNPQALLDGTMILGAFHVTLTLQQSAPFMSGVIAASFLWFTGLSLLISFFSRKFTIKHLRRINQLCSVIIIFYGAKLLMTFFSIFFI
ncbi:L-lysine permease [Megasphaera cerevisiae DSM 20462]|uniref:L-lysine permease n=1 Tax=Megasphaera cerevisiae DSM 20462 TaxID=1122219 RepID=A0A0J6ZNJ6_9FIRM|nr:LysE family transporter [Megasphaera cerevisiae]KMO86466.1 L-lysine permease [Megasphaera cerevisiae DSM 20462]OKY53381.1 L-lysine permease [Megasphaera cerevisiae]SJZ94705.1 L-lysine exporter family protein LysE/ArgO [Megasphaera cerevisiae DSM 20462]